MMGCAIVCRASGVRVWRVSKRVGCEVMGHGDVSAGCRG